MNMCLDEGMLQAYMDGELASAQLEACAAHLATCATCAELAHEAEHESTLCATAFASVLSVPAPTARLRVRLEDALAAAQAPPQRIAESPATRLRAWAAALTASFALRPRYIGAFASFLLAVALTVTLTMMRPKQPQSDGQIAGVQQVNAPVVAGAQTDNKETKQAIENRVGGEPTSSRVSGTGSRRSASPQFVKATDKPRVNGGRNADVEANKLAAQPAPLLPDEKNYMTTIATLDAAIRAQGQEALPPSLRAEYERNLAVVDQAIIATRVATRRNPQDTDAKAFLRAAYQNKVDLLTTVADQTQFIAARD